MQTLFQEKAHSQLLKQLFFHQVIFLKNFSLIKIKQNLLDLNYEGLKSFLSKEIGIEEKKLNMRTQQIFTAA